MKALVGILLAIAVLSLADNDVGMTIFETDPHQFASRAKDRSDVLRAGVTRTFPADLRGDGKPFFIEARFTPDPPDPSVAKIAGIPEDETVYGTNHAVIYAPGGAIAMVLPWATPIQALHFADRDFLLVSSEVIASDHTDTQYALLGWIGGTIAPLREQGFTRSVFALKPDERLFEGRNVFVDGGQLVFEAAVFAEFDPLAQPTRGWLHVAVDPDPEGGFLRVIQVSRVPARTIP